MTYAARGVSVRIGSATLLADVSIEVSPGEIVAVAGPNGAGKSTLIATLAGDRQPDQGTVTLAGRPLADWPRRELARRRAVMSTERAVAFAFSAEEVALMGRLPLHGGDPTEADRTIVRSLLEAVDCANLADRILATLSTGERQRVALARAIAQVAGGAAVAAVAGGVASAGGAAVDAVAGGAASAGGATSAGGEAAGDRVAEADERFLLLDEPTSSLDPAHQHTAMRLLRREADAGRGVLAVLHDLNLAAAYADRIVLMSAARVVAAGRPSEVLRADLLEQVFGIPMLVLPHPRLAHPLVIAEPQPDGA
jgi:iron complex transport system ATP-binding protein